MVYAGESGPLIVPDPQVTMGAAQVGCNGSVDILDCLSQRSEPWAAPVDGVRTVSYTHLTLPTIYSV